MILELPVRFTSDTEALHEWTTLHLEISKTAFLLVDCTFENPPESGVGEVIRQMLVPALAAVREVEMKPIFLYGGDRGAPHAIASELHGIRRGVTRQVSPWPLPAPEWVPGLAPQDGDAVIEKCGQNGFRATQLDAYLRSHGIETLLCAGVSNLASFTHWWVPLNITIASSFCAMARIRSEKTNFGTRGTKHWKRRVGSGLS